MKKAVLSDFDGTIVDTTEALLQEVRILSVGKPFSPTHVREQLAELGWKKFLLHLKFSESELPDVVRYICDAVAQTRANIHLVPGMEEVFLQAAKAGSLTGIVTSNTPMNVEKMLGERIQLFSVLRAGALSGKNEVLEDIVQQHDLSKDETYYVGDEERDIVAAKMAGIRSIAVGWGTSPLHILKKVEPDYCVDSAKQIQDILQG